MGESGILLLIFLLLLGAILAVSIVLIRKAERERDEALQHVADARTDFLSRISNDIKTPMNVIMGMTAVGLEESDHPEKMVECLGKIDTASRFLMGLLNDLVDVSMIELGRFRLHPKPYALEDFMEAIRDMTEPECAKKGITFHMSGGENSLNVMWIRSGWSSSFLICWGTRSSSLRKGERSLFGYAIMRFTAVLFLRIMLSRTPESA